MFFFFSSEYQQHLADVTLVSDDQTTCLWCRIGPAFLRHLARFERFNPPRPCLNVKMKESARKSQNPPWFAVAIAL